MLQTKGLVCRATHLVFVRLMTYFLSALFAIGYSERCGVWHK